MVSRAGVPANLWVRLWVLFTSPFKPVSDWPPLLRFWGLDKKNAAFPKEKRRFDHLKKWSCFLDKARTYFEA